MKKSQGHHPRIHNGGTIKLFLSWFVFIAFLALVEWLWGWEKILRPWLELKPQDVVISLGLITLSYAIRTLRLYDFFHPHVTWWPGLRLMLLNNFFNNLLPARTGEISFPVLMKRYFQIDYVQSTATLFWFRLLDLHALLSIAALAWLLQHRFTAMLMIAALTWLAFPWLFFLLKDVIWQRLYSNEMPESGQGVKTKLMNIARKGLQGLPDDQWQFIKSFVLTYANWLVKLLILVWFLNLFLDLDFKSRMLAIVAGELTSVLPIHAPGGFGTYEAGILSVLMPLTNHDQAANAAINVHLLILGSSLLGAAIGWLIPAKFDKNSRSG